MLEKSPSISTIVGSIASSSKGTGALVNAVTGSKKAGKIVDVIAKGGSPAGLISSVPGLNKIPGVGEISKIAESIPGLDKIVGSLGSNFPGLPVDPTAIMGLLSGKLNVEALAKTAIQGVLAIAVPGLGLIGGLVVSDIVDKIEDTGKAVVGILTGQPQKKTRRRKKWNTINLVFTSFVKKNPLLIFDGKKAPSARFVSAYRAYLLSPKAYYDVGLDPCSTCPSAVPTWLESKTAIEHDYADSGISRPGKTYLEGALKPEKIGQMLAGALQNSETKAIIERAIQSEAKKLAEQAAKLKAQQEAERWLQLAAQAKNKVAVDAAAKNPKSKESQDIKKKLSDKTKALKKSGNERVKKAKENKSKVKDLQKQIEKLKKQLKEKPDDKLLQSQASLTQQQMQATAVATASNATLAMMDQTQAAVTQSINNAITSGDAVKAQQLMTVFNSLNLQKENLRAKMQTVLDAQKKSIQIKGIVVSAKKKLQKAK